MNEFNPKNQPFMNQRIILFILLIFHLSEAKSQNNDMQAGLYNVLSGSLIGGAGALINKKPNEKMGKVFLKGFSQGALGGYLTFESKRLIRNFSDSGNYAYVWPSRLLNSAGNSIVLNAADNRDFWERYYLSIGFGHFEYDFQKEKHFNVRIMPFSLLGSIYGFTQGSLDLKRSLYIGHLFFKSYKKSASYRGKAIFNSIIINKDLLQDRSAVIGHELIHTYQNEDFMAFNSFFSGKVRKMEENNSFWKEFNTIFYPDLNALFFVSSYYTSTIFTNTHERRFYEKEAYYYSRSLINK